MNRVPHLNAWFFVSVQQQRLLKAFQESQRASLFMPPPVAVKPATENQFRILRLNKELLRPHAQLLAALEDELKDFPDSAC
jgi:hypothetical protein